MTKKGNKEEVPTITEEQNQLGEIKINLHVVGQIVRLAALNVKGVVEVGSSGIGDTIAEIFSKKETDRGVRIAEDDAGNYRIEIRVILRLGVELATVAYSVQEAISEQVSKMTNKMVSAVDVIIDGVKMATEEKDVAKKEWMDMDNID